MRKRLVQLTNGFLAESDIAIRMAKTNQYTDLIVLELFKPFVLHSKEAFASNSIHIAARTKQPGSRVLIWPSIRRDQFLYMFMHQNT